MWKLYNCRVILKQAHSVLSVIFGIIQISVNYINGLAHLHAHTRHMQISRIMIIPLLISTKPIASFHDSLSTFLMFAG